MRVKFDGDDELCVCGRRRKDEFIICTYNQVALDSCRPEEKTDEQELGGRGGKINGGGEKMMSFINRRE